MKKIIICFIFSFLSVLSLFPQVRKFAEVFPNISAVQRDAAFSSDGYLYYGTRKELLTITPATKDDLSISKSSLGPNPGFFVEALQVIPQKNISLLRIYNALGKIQGLKGKTYYSASSKKHIVLFPDAVRIEGPEKIRNTLPDPPPARQVALSEKLHVRFTDIRFGNCFYEITHRSDQQGILYRINNFRTITYGPIPVVKEKSLTVLLYIEPVEEGLAVYCIAGAEVSDFIAKYVDIPSALKKRMNIFIEWMLEGI